MERALPVDVSHEGRKHTLTAEIGPVVLSGDADDTKGLLTLSTIWVECGLSDGEAFFRGELNIYNADPSK